MTAQVVAISCDELDALHGAGPLAFTLYVLLRAWMDYGSGVVGRSRPVSLAMLAAYAEQHVTRGRGIQIVKPSEKEIRCALDRLQRAGLIRRLEGDRLLFSLPLALTTSARPTNAGRDQGKDSSTQPGTTEPAAALAMPAEPGTVGTARQASNRAHIMFHENPSSPPCALGDYLTRQDIQTAGRESTLARWRTEGVTPPDLAAAVATARAIRARERSLQPIGVGLVDRALTRRAAAPGAPPPGLLPDTALLAFGAARGCPPRPGESWQQYRSRLGYARE